MKAIALLSGGLDSTLAAKVVMEQGIELEALNFLTVFCTLHPPGRNLFGLPEGCRWSWDSLKGVQCL